MGKEALKERIKARQNGLGALSQEVLPEDVSHYDTDRITPKAEGGIYTDGNTRVVLPVEHMKRHGNYRERPEDMEHLKALLDDREQVRKLGMAFSNRLSAGLRRKTDTLMPETIEDIEWCKARFGKKLVERDKRLVKAIAEFDSPLITAALGVKGIGPITVAYCTVYIDLGKARHASSLWAYAGLDKPSHERYTKGVKGGGCKPLRTCLYTMAESQMKSRGAYREVYDQAKGRLAISKRTVMSRNTEGKLVETVWCQAKPCHRHGAALRKVMKHFLADYWYVGRTIMGLDTTPLYAESVLKGSHRTIMPEERGWVY